MSKHEPVTRLNELPEHWGNAIEDAGFSRRVQARVEQWRARRNWAFAAAGSVAAMVSGYQLTQLSSSEPVMTATESFLSPLAMLTTPSMLLALVISATACGVACVIPGRV